MNLQQRYQIQIKQQQHYQHYQPELRPAPQRLNPQLMRMFNQQPPQHLPFAKPVQPLQKQLFPFKQEAAKTSRCGTWVLSLKQKFQTLGKKISSCCQQVIAVLKKPFTPAKKKMAAAPIHPQAPLNKPVYVVRPLPFIPLPVQLPQYTPPQPKPAQTLPAQPDTRHNEEKQTLPTPLLTLQKRFIRPLPSLPQPKPQTPPISVQTNHDQNELEAALPQKQVEIPCENKPEEQIEPEIQAEVKAEETKQTVEVPVSTSQNDSHEVEKEAKEESHIPPAPPAPPIPPRIPAPAAQEQKIVNPVAHPDRKDFLNEIAQFNKNELKKQINTRENTPPAKDSKQDDLLDLVKKRLSIQREVWKEDEEKNMSQKVIPIPPTPPKEPSQVQEVINHPPQTKRTGLLNEIEGFNKKNLKAPKKVNKDLPVKQATVPLRDRIIQQFMGNVARMVKRG